MNNKERSEYVWNNAEKTKLYSDIIDDLLYSWMWQFKIAKDENDYAKIEIWVNYLWKYIVQLVNDTIEYISESEWWEESEDKYKKSIWLKDMCRYLNNKKRLKWLKEK